LPPRSVDRPIFWIVAEPNGSGKSTAYENTEIEAFARSVWIINPDVLTARIQAVEGRQLQEANLEAVRRIEIWLEAGDKGIVPRQAELNVKGVGEMIAIMAQAGVLKPPLPPGDRFVDLQYLEAAGVR
jgi:hypothetical protein